MSTCNALVFALCGRDDSQVAMMRSHPSCVIMSARQGTALMPYARESSDASALAGASDVSVR